MDYLDDEWPRAVNYGLAVMAIMDEIDVLGFYGRSSVCAIKLL